MISAEKGCVAIIISTTKMTGGCTWHSTPDTRHLASIPGLTPEPWRDGTRGATQKSDAPSYGLWKQFGEGVGSTERQGNTGRCTVRYSATEGSHHAAIWGGTNDDDDLAMACN